MSPEPIFSVSECVEALSLHLERLGTIVIQGEISSLKITNNRLVFITLKDAHAALDVFSLTHMIHDLPVLSEGMLVHVTGKPGLYKNSGKFRLFAHKIQPQGEGALQLAFDQLKRQLESEGLFDVSHKRQLPRWPKNIGLITAKNSSAYFDLVKIINARIGGLRLYHLPVNVQGLGAVQTILRAINYVNEHAMKFDLVILARGGGSLEDLMAFNHESVARAVFACKVPIISAIGHEDNWSLTDYTADLRASTPSNAAEIAVQNKADVITEIEALYSLIKGKLKAVLYQRHAALGLEVNAIHAALSRIKTQIKQVISPTFIKEALLHTIKRDAQAVEQLNRLVSSFHYQNVLARGFSITTNNQGTVIKSVVQVKPGDLLTTQFHTGTSISIITDIKGV